VKLKGKSAVITGASRGIGRAIAEAFAREGAAIGALARSREALEQLCGKIAEAGGRALPLVCDVTDRGQVEQAINEAASELGGIDILVNNAGGGQERTPVGEDDPATWTQVIELNLNSVYFCCRAAIPHLRVRGGGTIINVGSGMGHQARAGNSSYNAAKAGVWMLTRCLALELWPDKITVNELIPGPVETELTSSLFQADKPHPVIESEWVKHPEEVAPLAVFLATQSSKGPTGQSFSLARRPL